MLEKLKKAFVSRQKKEMKFEKSFARLEATTEKYLKAIQNKPKRSEMTVSRGIAARL